MRLMSAWPVGRCDLLSNCILASRGREIERPQSAHRARAARMPIAPRGIAARSLSAASLGAFGRQPAACAAPSLVGPASETLHMSRRWSRNAGNAGLSRHDTQHLKIIGEQFTAARVVEIPSV